MQNIRKFFYVATACLALCLSPMAFAQDDDEPDDEPEAASMADLGRAFKNMKISQKDAEQMASMVFRKEIKEKKLTVQQAGAYFKCGNEHYTQHMDDKAYMSYLESMDRLYKHEKKGTMMSDQEKAKAASAIKSLTQSQREAEAFCSKQLGINLPPGNLFPEFGKKKP